MPTIGDIYYRYDSNSDGRYIYLQEFTVAKVTPKGVWLQDIKKFILNNARKRFAYPTVELAKESFIIRKEWRIRYLIGELEATEKALQLAKDGKWEERGETFEFFNNLP